MNLENLMFLLISSEICNTDLSEELKSILTPEQINEVYILSKRHDMAHVTASALLKTDLSQTRGMQQILQKELMKAVYYDSQREYALQEVLSVLETAKIPCIPLKGAVICQYYPSTWMRTSCDIDILVHKEDTEHAIRYLSLAGFECEKTPHTAYDYALISPNGVHIELHFRLQQEELPKATAILGDIWQNVNLKPGYSYCYEIMPEMFILYHLAHMAKHLLHGGCGFRPFIDLWLIDKKLLYEKEKLRSLLKEAGLLEFWNATSALAKEWMEGIPYTQDTELLARYILEGGTYGTIKNSAQIQSGNGGSKLEYFLKLAFPPRTTLEVVYPSLKDHPYLFPLYYVRRFFFVFERSKRDKALMMLFARNRVTEPEIETSRRMLERLGLLN